MGRRKPKDELNQPIGKICQKMLGNNEKCDPTELFKDAIAPDYIQNLREAVRNGEKAFSGDFFIEVLTRNQKHLPGVLHFSFVCKQICPYASCNQSVFKLYRTTGDLKFMWCLPQRELVDVYESIRDINILSNSIFKYVPAFLSGELDNLERLKEGQSVKI